MANDIEDLLNGILGALERDTPKLRRKLREALEQGLDLAFNEPGVDVEIHVDVETDQPSSEADVTVLDGGRTANQPMTESDGPDLSVVEGEGGPTVSVEVLRASEFESAPKVVKRGKALRSGRILVVNEEQPVYAGSSARCTRVSCDEGGFEVFAEGTLVGQLNAGQTVDVETRTLTVRGAGQGEYRAV